MSDIESGQGELSFADAAIPQVGERRPPPPARTLAPGVSILAETANSLHKQLEQGGHSEHSGGNRKQFAQTVFIAPWPEAQVAEKSNSLPK